MVVKSDAVHLMTPLPNNRNPYSGCKSSTIILSLIFKLMKNRSAYFSTSQLCLVFFHFCRFARWIILLSFSGYYYISLSNVSFFPKFALKSVYLSATGILSAILNSSYKQIFLAVHFGMNICILNKLPLACLYVGGWVVCVCVDIYLIAYLQKYEFIKLN